MLLTSNVVADDLWVFDSGGRSTHRNALACGFAREIDADDLWVIGQREMKGGVPVWHPS
jgi:hypothetical protein